MGFSASQRNEHNVLADKTSCAFRNATAFPHLKLEMNEMNTTDQRNN